MSGEEHFTYECKENDNSVELVLLDGILDEIWLSDCTKKSWGIVGFNDLNEALSLRGYKIERM